MQRLRPLERQHKTVHLSRHSFTIAALLDKNLQSPWVEAHRCICPHFLVVVSTRRFAQ